MRGQSTFFCASFCWPTAPSYAVPEIVTQFSLSFPIAWMAAARIGLGSTNPAGNGDCCVATDPPATANSPATITGNANFRDILPPLKGGP